MSFSLASRKFSIQGVSAQQRATARSHQTRLTKPAGSLGQLEELAVQLAAIQTAEKPSARPAQALIFAADHPVVQHGVSAFRKKSTSAMVHNIVRGGAACGALARLHRIPLEVVDVGVDNLSDVVATKNARYVREKGPADGIVGDLAMAEAMAPSTYNGAVCAGQNAVDRHPSVKVLVIGELGIGNTTAATAVTGQLLGLAAEEIVGRGTGVDNAGLARKTEAIKQALAHCSADTPEEVIAQVAVRDIAAM